MVQKEKVVIVGSGPAGYTAAIYTARANLSPILYTGSLPGGLLTQTSEVENFPGFPKGVSGFDLLTGMQEQAERFGTRVEFDAIESFELTDHGPQKLCTASGVSIEAEALILATGATPRNLGLPSEERLRGKGVSFCATCDGAFFKDVPVVVVGGGDSAMEEAIFLTRFASKVIVVHRRDQLRASKIMADRALKNPKIEFVWSSVVQEIEGEKKVEGVRVSNLLSGKEKVIPCRACFVALGHVPNTALFNCYLDHNKEGFIRLQGTTSKTNLAGVFVAGDCADAEYRQAITAAAAGCRAGIDAERYLESR